MLSSGILFRRKRYSFSKKQRNKKSVYNLWLGRDNEIKNEDFVLFLRNIKESLLFLNNITKRRVKKDKILYQKYKLNLLVEKLLNV